MDIKDATKEILKSSSNTYRSVAPAFNTTPETSAAKLGRDGGIKRIADFIKLCDYCNADIIVKLQDGQEIKLTIK